MTMRRCSQRMPSLTVLHTGRPKRGLKSKQCRANSLFAPFAAMCGIQTSLDRDGLLRVIYQCCDKFTPNGVAMESRMASAGGNSSEEEDDFDAPGRTARPIRSLNDDGIQLGNLSNGQESLPIGPLEGIESDRDSAEQDG